MGAREKFKDYVDNLEKLEKLEKQQLQENGSLQVPVFADRSPRTSSTSSPPGEKMLLPRILQAPPQREEPAEKASAAEVRLPSKGLSLGEGRKSVKGASLMDCLSDRPLPAQRASGFGENMRNAVHVRMWLQPPDKAASKEKGGELVRSSSGSASPAAARAEDGPERASQLLGPPPQSPLQPQVEWRSSSKGLVEVTLEPGISFGGKPQRSDPSVRRALVALGVANSLQQEKAQSRSPSPQPPEIVPGYSVWQRQPLDAGGAPHKVGGSDDALEGEDQDVHSGGPSIAPLAETLIDSCGSLERAFAYFDYNKKKKVSRLMFATGCAGLRLDVQALCGMPFKHLWKMLERADPTGKGDITLEVWINFFTGHLEGSGKENLVGVDHGDLRGQAWEKFMNEKSEKRKATKGTSHKTAEEAHAAEGLRRVRTLDLADLDSRPSSTEPMVASKSFGGGRGQSRFQMALELPVSKEASGDLPRALSARSLGGRVTASGDLTRALSARSLGGRVTARFADSAGAGAAEGAAAEEARRRAGSAGAPASGTADVDMLDAAASPEESASEAEPQSGAEGSRARSAHRATSKMSVAMGTVDEFIIEDSSEDDSSGDDRPKMQRTASGRLLPGKSGGRKSRKTLQQLPCLASHLQKRATQAGQAEEQPVFSSEHSGDLVKLKTELDLEGIEALAFALLEKFGSLRKAYKWFDTINNGLVSHVAWVSGLGLLHMDVEKITKVTGEALWSKLDPNLDGNISYKEWMGFFSVIDPEKLKEWKKAFAAKAAAGHASDEQASQQGRSLKHSTSGGEGRSMKRSDSNRRTLSRKATGEALDGKAAGGADGKAAGGAEGEDTEEVASGQHGARGSRSRARGAGCDGDRARATGGGSGGEEDGSPGSASSSSQAGAGFGAQGSSGQPGDSSGADAAEASGSSVRRKVGEAGHRGGAQSALIKERQQSIEDELAAMDVEEFRKHVRFQLGAIPFGGSHRFNAGLSTRERDIIQEVASSLKLHACSEEDGALLVANLAEFAAQIRTQLLALEDDASVDFNVGVFSQAQRHILEVTAKELALSCHAEGEGENELMVVFRSDNFAERTRLQLQELKSGETAAFPARLTATQRLIVRRVAQDLSLYAHETKNSATTSIEVFNLSKSVEDIRAKLCQVAAGEHLELAGLSPEEVKVALCLAEDYGLSSLLQRKRNGSVLVLANLGDWLKQVKVDLQNLLPGEGKDFADDISALQVAEVVKIAEELRLHHGMAGSRRKPHLKVTCTGEGSEEFALGQQGSRTRSKSSDNEDDWEDSEDMYQDGMINQIFDAYATGMHRTGRIFLRFPDLNAFAEEVSAAMPEKHKVFLRFAATLEHIFDDTLQLQWDLGMRTKKGLNRKWFQVFIQKAMQAVGIQIVQLLHAILNEHAPA